MSNNAVPGGGQHLPQPDPVGRPLVGDAGVRDGLDQHSGGAVGCAGPARFKEQLPHGGWDGADALADLAGAPLMSCVVGVGRGARESTACQCVAIRPSPDPRSRHNTHNGEEAFLFFPSTKDEPQAVRKRRDWRQRTQHGRGLARLAPCTLRARARQSTLRTSQKPTRRPGGPLQADWRGARDGTVRQWLLVLRRGVEALQSRSSRDERALSACSSHAHVLSVLLSLALSDHPTPHLTWTHTYMSLSARAATAVTDDGLAAGMPMLRRPGRQMHDRAFGSSS